MSYESAVEKLLSDRNLSMTQLGDKYHIDRVVHHEKVTKSKNVFSRIKTRIAMEIFNTRSTYKVHVCYCPTGASPIRWALHSLWMIPCRSSRRSYQRRDRPCCPMRGGA
eukprot:1661632-Amphidinium_carterae.1